MTFLPIVDRELRISARKRGTFWVRVTAALVAIVIAGGFLLLSTAEVVSTSQLGSAMFGTLSWMSFAVALSAGMFFTSDCLSEEKREGTLGFLFLTDLRGYDVVLGKLIATSLRCVFALLAIFPILAITQLMGGVAPVEFWKVLLALVHALFFSLATGMFVSALSRHGQKAMSGTLLLMVVFVAGGPLTDWIIGLASGHGYRTVYSLPSPATVFITAGGWSQNFWNALLISQAAAWAMLVAACVLIPRNWQEKSSKLSPRMMRWQYWWRYGGAKRREALRRKLLTLNPVTWLASRERWQLVSVWVVTVAFVAGYAAIFIFNLGSEFYMVWSFISGAVTLIFYLWAASQACSFFADARRSGLVELLLATPLTGREIVHGPWRALVRMFTLPVGIFLLVQLTVPILGAVAFGQRSMARVSFSGMVGGFPWLLTVVNALASSAVTVANLIALCWFGMWMGLASKNARLATLKTLVFVWIAPLIVMTFASGIAMYLLIIPTMMGSSTGGSPKWFSLWYPMITAALTTGLALAKDALFFFWARKKLLRDFREMATRAVAPVCITATPVLPPVPPVMPASGTV
ncbi:MAG: hypothetical protein EXS35_14920 [Pedosphaera sp.]|nr:hypothetical protein [Pedosphaera sp.]